MPKPFLLLKLDQSGFSSLVVFSAELALHNFKYYRYAVRGEEMPRGSQVTEHIIIGTPGKVFFNVHIDFYVRPWLKPIVDILADVALL